MNVIATDFFEEIMLADTINICSDNPDNYGDLLKCVLASGMLKDNSFSLMCDKNVQKITVADQGNLLVAYTGMANYVALSRDENGKGKLGYVTTCTMQRLIAGGTVSLPGWSITFTGPEWSNRLLKFSSSPWSVNAVDPSTRNTSIGTVNKIISGRCIYCGNKSGRVDVRGNCISCGAQL
jgi:hypothetical protein